MLEIGRVEVYGLCQLCCGVRACRPGCYWCRMSVADSKWMSFKMTASFDVEQLAGTSTVVVRESFASAGRLLRPALSRGHCLVLHAVWAHCTAVLTGARHMRHSKGYGYFPPLTPWPPQRKRKTDNDVNLWLGLGSRTHGSHTVINIESLPEMYLYFLWCVCLVYGPCA